MTAEAWRTLATVVRLTPGCRHELDEIEWHDDREVGGWAFGYFDRDEIVIEELRGANYEDGKVGDRNSVTLSGHYASDTELKLKSWGLQAVGAWHSHPQTLVDEPLRLSYADEEAARHAARVWKQPHASVLFGPADVGEMLSPWGSPRKRAWIADTDGTIRSARLVLDQVDH